MESTIQKYEQEISDLRTKRKEIIREAKKQAEQIIQDSNAVIENTIREIKEAQAEKERTRNARQELDAFRQELDNQNHEHDEMIERKMRQIQDRKKRKEDRKKEKAQQQANQTNAQATAAAAAQKTQAFKSPLNTGDYVKLAGQTTIGTIESIKGKQATVIFGMLRTTVDLKRLQKASAPEKQSLGTVTFVSKETQNRMRETHLNFHQEIDVRGLRGDEALQEVTLFIDDAILVGASRVRILHGTGTGALRQLIRQYLNTIPSVKSAKDEHVQFGGAGITVVEFS